MAGSRRGDDQRGAQLIAPGGRGGDGYDDSHGDRYGDRYGGRYGDVYPSDPGDDREFRGVDRDRGYDDDGYDGYDDRRQHDGEYGGGSDGGRGRGDHTRGGGRGPRRSAPDRVAPWSSVVRTLLLPGVGLWRFNPVLASALFSLGVILPGAFLAVVITHPSKDGMITLADAHRSFPAWLNFVGVIALVTRLIAVVLTAQVQRRRVRTSFRATGLACIIAALVPGVLVYRAVDSLNGVTTQVFGQGRGRTREVASGNLPLVPGSTPGVPQTTVKPLPTYDEEIHTVLLVGSDESSIDRFGARTDTMILAFVNRATGRTALVSIPRNLVGLTWPEGSAMAAAFPNGFHDGTQMANAVNQTVMGSPKLRAAYDRKDAVPGIHALIEGLVHSFQITIDDYAMVNSCSFVKIIDAVGPIVIDVPARMELPHGKFPCLKYELGKYLEPGKQSMDGTLAFGFARQRHLDSDNGRMARQRQLIQAIAKQMSFTKVLANFNDLAAAIIGDVRTSLGLKEAKELATGLQKAMKGEGIQGFALGPPLIVNRDRNMQLIHDVLYLVKKRLVEGKPIPQNTEQVREAMLRGEEPPIPAPATPGVTTTEAPPAPDDETVPADAPTATTGP